MTLAGREQGQGEGVSPSLEDWATTRPCGGGGGGGGGCGGCGGGGGGGGGGVVGVAVVMTPFVWVAVVIVVEELWWC